jgi:hypothetical protein
MNPHRAAVPTHAISDMLIQSHNARAATANTNGYRF